MDLKNNVEPIVVERTYDALASKVWEAITNNKLMKHWYFDIDDFKPEVGFEFHFEGGSPTRKYMHLCKVTEIIPGKKIAYSWRYENYPGNSEVSFELFQEGDKTKLRLTHTGIETFPQESKDFAKASFTEGWNHIIGMSLKDYLESNK
jgi:uncharacterized protein YndB with AHSA1/START domain